LKLASFAALLGALRSLTYVSVSACLVGVRANPNEALACSSPPIARLVVVRVRKSTRREKRVFPLLRWTRQRVTRVRVPQRSERRRCAVDDIPQPIRVSAWRWRSSACRATCNAKNDSRVPFPSRFRVESCRRGFREEMRRREYQTATFVKS